MFLCRDKLLSFVFCGVVFLNTVSLNIARQIFIIVKEDNFEENTRKHQENEREEE